MRKSNHTPAWGKSRFALVAAAAGLAVLACHDDDAASRPPKIYFASNGSYEIAPGDTLNLLPRILYDDGCAFEWQDGDGNILSTERDLLFTTTVMRDYALTFRVHGAAGADTFSLAVSVQLKASFDKIDNFSTKKSSILALHPDSLPGAFRVGGMEFANAVNADTTMWVGFAFSNKSAASSATGSSAIGAAYVVGGASSSANAYMAVYSPSGMARVLFDRDYTPKSVDVANDNFIYLASKFGFTAADSAVVQPAARGDYFRVEVAGLGADGMPTGAVASVSLIDCDFDNPAKYVRSSSWNTLDLTGLGSVRGLQMSVATSLASFPELFCIDNLRLQD